jgi:hypothetical protein
MNARTLRMMGGILLGLAICITIGVLTDEIGLGVAFGVPLGIGLGYFLQGEPEKGS